MNRSIFPTNKMLDLFEQIDKTPEQIRFIKQQLSKKEFRVIYFIWKQDRINKRYIGFMIDKNALQPRRAAIFKTIEIIAERPISDIEFNEECAAYGFSHRRVSVWNYSMIQGVIDGDEKYGIKTPDKFIKEVKRRGIEVKVLPKAQQLIIEL